MNTRNLNVLLLQQVSREIHDLKVVIGVSNNGRYGT